MPYVLYMGRQAIHGIWKRLVRKGPRWFLFFLPEDKKRASERRIRGREEYRKLRLADCAVVSFGKSGRTWLRVMLSRVYQLKHGLPGRYLLGFDNLHYKNSAIPKIFFTHDNYIKDFTGNDNSKSDFYDKKVILLVRDPRDIAVSQFFQWKHRMRPAKKAINQYPQQSEDVAIFDFVLSPDSGLPKIIRFLNLWAKELPRIENALIVRYEDLRSHPEENLKRITEFLETTATEEQVKESVAFAAYDNMKKMEQKRVFWLSGRRLMPRDRKDPNSYKVRRAKVGGYRDYFNDQQVAEIDELVRTTLSPVYGYTDSGQRRQAAVAQA